MTQTAIHCFPAIRCTQHTILTTEQNEIIPIHLNHETQAQTNIQKRKERIYPQESDTKELLLATILRLVVL